MSLKLIAVAILASLAVLPYILESKGNVKADETLVYLGSADGKSFYAESTRMTWRFALGHCRAFGMELASITSEAQRDVLGAAYNIPNFTGGHWTSGRDTQRLTQFVWDMSGETPDGSLLKLGVMPSLQSCLLYYTHENINSGDYHSDLCSRENRVLCEQIDEKSE